MEGISGALKVYRRLVSESLQRAVMDGVAAAERRGIFSSAVTIWLMILQRLKSDHSLEAAVAELRAGWLNDLLEGGSLPARARRISAATGGLARARERLKVEVVERVVDGISAALEESHRGDTHEGLRIYVLDGTTLRTTHTARNVERYSQYQNQYGKAHYPLLRVGVLTNAVTGVVQRPSFGPYNGEDATDELSLAEELLTRVAPGSIIIGDRYFGCCRFASMALQAGHEVITRVKEGNARKFIDIRSDSSGEVSANWESHRSRTGSFYTVAGRFIWHTIRLKGFRPKRLVLFTTSNLPWQRVVELYRLRWNVELDLRDIKSTLKMDMLYSKTPEMGAKELMLGIAAYNLIRHIATVSAKILKINPRELSFTRVLRRVHIVGSSIVSSNASAVTVERSLRCILSDLNSLKLPRRKKPRPNEPRKIWRKGRVDHMTRSRKQEREALNQPQIISTINQLRDV